MSENYSSKRGRWQRLSESLPAELRGQVSLRNVEAVAALPPEAQAEALARPYPPSEMDVNKMFEELCRAVPGSDLSARLQSGMGYILQMTQVKHPDSSVLKGTAPGSIRSDCSTLCPPTPDAQRQAAPHPIRRQ